nr:hypothetical protein BaRGS_003822 [Batillaria attramentaria]
MLDDMVTKVFQEIDNIIIRSLQSVQKIIINDKHCFEMYGYDILLDDELKPGKEDYDLKSGLLHDVLNVIDLENRYTFWTS